MPKYRVSWTEETWYHTYIEAESEDEALELFWNDEGDCMSRAKPVDSEIQDSVEVEAIEGEAIYG